MMNSVTIEKRAQLATFIERVVCPIPAIRALLGIGSIAVQECQWHAQSHRRLSRSTTWSVPGPT